MFTTRPEIRGTFGVVTSTHYLATLAGWQMLERGGNAFDAAVATGLALQVVHPYQNGPGGDLPAVLYSAKKGKVEVVCGQGVAPQAATIEKFQQLGLRLVPGTGLLAAVVPGAFDAWMLILRDYGRLSLRDVLEPAIAYAYNGFAVVPMMKSIIGSVEELFRGAWTSSAAQWLVDGKSPAVGRIHRTPKIGETYARLLKEAEAKGKGREGVIEAGRDVFYKGFVAEEVDRFSRTTRWIDSSGEVHGGLLSGDDMARWRASVEPPVSYDYKGWTVHKAGPWSQSPVMLQQLALLDGFDVAGMDPQGADFIHLQVECAKLALADREAWYGDPAVNDVPMKTLLSKAYNDARRRLVRDRASMTLEPGAPDGRNARMAAYTTVGEVDIAGTGAGEPNDTAASGIGEPNAVRGGGRIRDAAVRGPADGDTVHLDVADAEGNMISCTPSGGWLQSSPTIPSLGFCLGTRAQMFWLEHGYPSSLHPGIRPRTTLSPTLATREGRPALAWGTPGGDKQDQWALTAFLLHVHHGYDLQAACDAPQFHTDHLPSSFYPRVFAPGSVAVESRIPQATVDELRRRGHQVQVVGDWELGRTTMAGSEMQGSTLVLKAGAHPRYQEAYAMGR
ncbi:MAG: gamma-glutamyltransferase family protein [Alphaproteobacteria bacterium]|nr:gamma-glutamyltransferase family protein [Alphaproteobacteria bacterium]